MEMSNDLDSSPVELENKSYIGTVDDRTNRIMQPDRPESGVRINQMAVFGILCCLFLTLLGLGANLYFVISNTRDCATETRAMRKQFAQMAAKIGEVAKSVSSLQAKFDTLENDNRHTVSSQYEHTALLTLVTKDLNETQETLEEHFKTTISKEQIQLDILENIMLEFDVLKTTLNKLETYTVTVSQSLIKQTATLAALNSTFKAAVDNQITERRIYLGMLDTMNSSLTSIELSVTFSSIKQEDLTLSSAVLTLLDQTSTVHAAIMNASNQQPTCGKDGCFVKVIPVGLPASSTFVQKENVRLANAQISPVSIMGRLEVYMRNSWGYVCDDSFDDVDARVVCRMFGYSSGQQKPKAFFGQGKDPIQMDAVQCSGSESSILSCSHMSNHNCAHGEDVGVICT